MKGTPLVSVTIPTYNAAKTLPLCLESVRRQEYPAIEVVVVDRFSRDGTREIARSFGARVVDYPGMLFGARYQGLQASRGDYVLLLDSDMVLKRCAIQRSVALMGQYDMLVLEEESYNKEWLIPWLYDASKRVISARFNGDYAFDPLKGGNPARFFKRWVLEQAFAAVPPSLGERVLHFDHDILYYEAYRVTQRVGLLRDAVYHHEPNLAKLWRTNLRYGASLHVVRQTPYWSLFLKERGSGFWFGRPFGVGLRALLLALLLRGVQSIGFWGYRLGLVRL